MPPRKKNIVTIEPWPALRQRRLYEARIKSAIPDKAAGLLRATIENLDVDQLGRIHEVKLPLPVRPGNRACAFLAACGIDATAVGTTVDLDRFAGVIVGMRFRGLSLDGTEEFDFEPLATASPAASKSPSGDGPLPVSKSRAPAVRKQWTGLKPSGGQSEGQSVSQRAANAT